VARGGRVGILGSQDMMDTPFSVTNFTQLLIQNQQAASIGDVLQNDPAVRVARGFGNYQQVYIVRGLPVFSDDMSYNGLYGLLPRQYLAAELVERVEVLHGASAFLNGAAPGGSGLGGAINVSPKRAPNEPLNEVTLGVESGGQGYAAVDIARRFGPDQSLGLRLNAVRRDGKTEVDGEKRELSLVSIGADFRSGNLRVSADLGYQDHRLEDTQPSVTIAAGLPIPSAPEASKNLAQPWVYSNERDTFGTVRAEYDIAPNMTAWAAFGARHGDESNDLANPTVVDAAGNTLASRFLGTRTDRVSTGEVGLRTRLQTGSIGHTLVVSAASYRAKTDSPFAFSDFGPNFFGTIPSNLYSPAASAPPPATALVGRTLGDVKTSSFAVADTLAFMQDTVLLTLGARHQRIEDGPYDETSVTPVTGVVFKLNKMASLYATYIEGLVRGDTAPATSGATPVTNAGEVFAPYRTKQTEVGLKIDTGRFGGSLSVFQTRKPIYSVDPATLVFGLTDHQRNQGIELSVFGEPMSGLRLLGGATYLDTDVSGKDAIGAPKTQFNLGAEWDVPGVRGLAVNGRAVHTASQYADAANLQRVPAWSRFDLGARYSMPIGQQELTIRARVENVANRDYWASVGGFPGAGYLVLGAPRTFVLSGTLSF
jgi:iron complex outermembrane receptor protein